jgi:hypothetical protein
MDEKNEKRKAKRFPCSSPAKIAYYVPVEYEVCYGPSCFRSTIVDHNENGLGITLEDQLAENTVVNIIPDQERQSEENTLIDKIYQSKVKWVKTNQEDVSGPFRIGVQHIV